MNKKYQKLGLVLLIFSLMALVIVLLNLETVKKLVSEAGIIRVRPTIIIIGPTPTPTPPITVAPLVCGNAVCEAGEDRQSCPRDCLVKNISFVKDEYGNERSGLKPAYSPAGDRIAFYRSRADGYTDIYLMNADGSNEVCLTCNKPQLPGKYVGVPHWHPGGKYLAFMAQKKKHALPWDKKWTHPGIGLHNDIWLASSDGSKFWQLTNLKTKQNIFDRTPASIAFIPVFSRDGTKLAWTERIDEGGEYKFGIWRMAVADFLIDENNLPPDGPLPKNTVYNTGFLKKMSIYQPGEQKKYYEINDFSIDNQKILFCGNLEPGQSEVGLDIYEVSLADLNDPNKKPRRLTNTLDVFDESGHYSPDGQKITWLSTFGYPTQPDPDWTKWARTDLRIMEANTSNQAQLTYFNQAGTFDYNLVSGRRVIFSQMSWHPSGTRRVASFTMEVAEGVWAERMVFIDF